MGRARRRSAASEASRRRRKGPSSVRAGELFADHYSQARQFYLSQTDIEQTHIKDAFTFELSKVETPAIRERVVAHLCNVDEALAKGVADGLGLAKLPEAAEPARPVVTDLEPSDALSIAKNGPESFAGRKVGILVSDGVDADLLGALTAAVEAEGAMVELVAPKIQGVTDSAGGQHPAKQKVNGGPSVLYDAVALLVSEKGAALLMEEATARDFVADAFAHAKFIAFAKPARPLIDRAGARVDDGVVLLEGQDSVNSFVALCRKLRFWQREAEVHSV